MKYRLFLALVITTTFISCKDQHPSPKTYHSTTLNIQQLTPNTFIHISYLETQDYGKVACNGLVYARSGEAIILDTPITDDVSNELIEWIEKQLDCKVEAVVPTHFHDDCLGGLKAFHRRDVLSVANNLTIELAKRDSLEIPKVGFDDIREISIGNQTVILQYFGEGHTSDNIVAYIPSEKVLFGGCLIKAMGAGKGYLGDANVEAWSETVSRIKVAFPDVEHVVPGHGKAGGVELLDYTEEKFLNVD
ncbi:subclass B1 metallo-beta-lactamase [Sungkyunkwania multivorans]|uniref:beta-lactamase n=1 Tax=Sungkyunkwania multivorans TaxID=1173618 RepID=A0ABW3CWP0_9FLAO